MSRLRALALLAASAALVSACSGADPAPEPTAAAPPAASPAVASPTSPPASAPSASAPEELRFSAATVDGRPFAGSSLAGRPAVLWFWAPWCTVCRSEAPDIDALQRRFGDRVQFVGVAGLGEVPAMQRFVADTGLGRFPHVVDADGALWARFGVAAQPAFAFVRRDGEIEVTAGALAADDLAARLDRLARG